MIGDGLERYGVTWRFHDGRKCLAGILADTGTRRKILHIAGSGIHAETRFLREDREDERRGNAGRGTRLFGVSVRSAERDGARIAQAEQCLADRARLFLLVGDQLLVCLFLSLGGRENRHFLLLIVEHLLFSDHLRLARLSCFSLFLFERLLYPGELVVESLKPRKCVAERLLDRLEVIYFFEN